MKPALSPRAHEALDKILAGTWRANLGDYDVEGGSRYELHGNEIVLYTWSAYPPQISSGVSARATTIYRELRLLMAPFEELTRKIQHEGLDAVSDAHYAQAAKTALEGLSDWPMARKAVAIQALHVLGHRTYRHLIGEPDQVGVEAR